MDMILSSSASLPEGMLATPSGRVVADDGYGRLVQLLDEAYELRNDHVVVSIVGREPFQLFVGDHVHADGSIRICDGLDVMPGGTIREPRDAGDGIVDWRGGHTIGSMRTERFRIDGLAATIVLEDAMAEMPAYEK